ncbi:MAG: ABC transporter ATP-binding protein [Desulfurococcales archaeon]|nr:ABC transporter ATP-binding protein [Desulfurococcales archaeon]
MIILENVTAGYNGITVLKDVSLEISDRTTIILGPNGAGKTTLFRVITGVLPPYTGSVTVNGRDIYRDGEARRLIGYLPHRNGLIRELTVWDNLYFYSKIYGLSDEAFQDKVGEVARILGIEDLLDKKVSELSFGQQKRAALGRILLHDPEVLVLDEPTQGLDPLSARKVRDYLSSLSGNRLVVMSTHNLYEAMDVGDTVCILNRGSLHGCYSREWIIENAKKSRIRIYYRGDISGVKKELAGWNIEFGNGYLELSVGRDNSLNEVLSILIRNNIRIVNVKEIGNPLEELLENIAGGGG